jgi:hypothetical protein
MICRHANLFHVQAVGAYIVIVIGFDSEFEVSDSRINLQKEFAVSTARNLEFLDTFFLVTPGLDPEFTLKIDSNVCESQGISPRQAWYEHDPIFVPIRVYSVKLRVSGEDLQRQFAF